MTPAEKQIHDPRLKALAEVLRELEKNGLHSDQRIEKKINIKLRFYKFVYYKTRWNMLNCLKQQKMMIFI